MANATLYDASGKSKGNCDLPAEIFATEINGHLLYEAVKNYLANQRSGNAHTKDRSEITGSTAKLYRQKGTGRARAGSAKSPTRYGGGTAFGPKTRDHSYKMPRKARRRALLSALSDRASEGNILVVEDLSMDEPKTQVFVGLLKEMGLAKDKVLLVMDNYDINGVAGEHVRWRQICKVAGGGGRRVMATSATRSAPAVLIASFNI